MVKATVQEQPALGELQNLFTRLEKATGDLRPAFEIIASDFYKSNKFLIFEAKPGRYKDLSPDYKAQKQKVYGNIYPMLVASGRLEESLTVRGGNENITLINPRRMTLGSKTPYATWLQTGTRKMPARPPLLIDVGRRVFRWIRIINANVFDRVKR